MMMDSLRMDCHHFAICLSEVAVLAPTMNLMTVRPKGRVHQIGRVVVRLVAFLVASRMLVVLVGAAVVPN